MKKTFTTLVLATAALTLSACSPADTPEPAPTVTATVTASPTATPTVTKTAKPSATPTATQTVTQSPQGPDGTVLDRARFYMEASNMSKQGLINALVAEGWSYETAEETEAQIRPEYNYDQEAIQAAKEYLQYAPDAGREELINYLHYTLLFTKDGSTRIVDTELGLKWY